MADSDTSHLPEEVRRCRLVHALAASKREEMKDMADRLGWSYGLGMWLKGRAEMQQKLTKRSRPRRSIDGTLRMKERPLSQLSEFE